MQDLTTFCEHMISAANKRKCTFTAANFEAIKNKFGNMKNDVAHSHLLKMERELTAVMANSTNTLVPEHGVAWENRCDVQQCIKWMEGKIILK